ncbi:MAG: hypothetical protein J6O41_07325 [Clostridia bacterium]|nr:hypothetical protein [Clostridia bacterium]
MENIFRSLSFTITQLVYPLISYLYNIFELIAKNQFFTNSDIEALSQNIYIIISACMLFTLGLKLLSAIVNPDALDGESGGKGTKRTAKSIFFSILIALFLIILIPIGFNWLYTIQSNDKETGILDRHLVEKIVLGTDTTEDHVPGQILASYAFASFCHPRETVSVESIANDGGNLYNLAITENIEYIRDMDGVINSKTDGEYDIEYHAILSPAVGLFLTYEMILICIDIALRSIKLGLLQLITSVVLCGYVVAGSDLLKRWAKEVMSTYLIVYIKIAAMSFMVYGLSLLEGFLDRLDFADDSAGFWSRGLIRVFVIIGLLQLVRQLPDLINKIFGTNIQRRGGIRGRLGEMAAVGDIAQRAWDQLRTHPLQTGQRLLSAPVSAIGGYFSNRAAVMKKGDDVRRRVLENGGTEEQARRARRATIEAGMAGSFGAMFRAGRAGWQNGNLQGIGAQGRRYDETHSTDAIADRVNQGWAQRLDPRNNDNLRAALGLRTRLEQQQEEDKYLDIPLRRNGVIQRDANGNVITRRASFDEVKARQSINNAFNTSQSNIRNAIEDEMNDATTYIHTFNLGTHGGENVTGNADQIRQMLKKFESENTIGAGELAQLKRQFETEFVNAADNLQNTLMNTGDARGLGIRGGRIAAVNNELNTIFDLVDHNAEFAEIVQAGNGGQLNIQTYTDLSGEQQRFVSFNNFRDGARNAVANDASIINRAVTDHDQQIEARSNTAEDRAITGSHNATQARRNNGGNNHGGNNNG